MASQKVQPNSRLQYMVKEIGTTVLRQVFDAQVGHDFMRYLYTNKTCKFERIQFLVNERMISSEQAKVLPPLNSNPDSSQFDHFLLTCLLRNVCDLCSSLDPVWKAPSPTDFRIEADLTRLRCCRNDLMHDPMFLPEAELNRRIGEVARILHRLNVYVGNPDVTQIIIEAQHLPFDELEPLKPGHNIKRTNKDITGNIVDQPLIREIPAKTLLRLSSVSLYGFKLEHNSFEKMVKYLSINVLIENINLSYVSCYHHKDSDTDCTLTLNLDNHTKLTSLCLYGVNIVCDRVNCSSLQSIKLYPISKKVVDSYITVFNCIMGSHLEHLDIYGSLAMYEDNTLKSLTYAVKTLKNIKLLKLSGMNLTDDVSLQLHPGVTQVKIVLEHVTMSEKCFQSIIANFVERISEAHVELDCCMIKPVGESHLKSWQKTVRYVCLYFTAIPAVQVTHQDKCCIMHFRL